LSPIVCTFLAGTSRADPPEGVQTPQTEREVIEKGLEFLKRDAALWRKDRQCSTCHHGTMTVWALYEAKSQGYKIPADELADVVKWTKDRLLERIDLPRDERPGWSMVNTPAMVLALMAWALPAQESMTADELTRISAHLVRHQETDGSWAWSSAPPKNRPPPFFESDEVATLLGLLAIDPPPTADPSVKSQAADARRKAASWLAAAPPTETTQALAYEVLLKVHDGGIATPPQAEIDLLLGRQNDDGGWGQLSGAPSDAYATGQVLYVLILAGTSRDRPEIRRAAAFLVATQEDDGSWRMSPRSHPDAAPANNLVPITYFGSAWATLGLLRAERE
jgi:hypothetical protein